MRAFAVAGLLLLAFATVCAAPAFAADAPAPVPDPIPPNPYADDPLEFINQLFTFAVAIAGLLAFGMIVYGGFQYTIAAGNPGKQSDARDRITQALIGVLLLFGSVMILNVINPNIAKTQLPALSPIKPVPGPGEPGGGCQPPCEAGFYCANSFTCQPLQCVGCEIPPNTCQVKAGRPTCVTPNLAVNHCVPGDPFYFCGAPQGNVTNCNTPCLQPNTCTFRGSGAGGGPDYRCTKPGGGDAF